jgi:hypothetical protein
MAARGTALLLAALLAMSVAHARIFAARLAANGAITLG